MLTIRCEFITDTRPYRRGGRRELRTSPVVRNLRTKRSLEDFIHFKMRDKKLYYV